MDLLIERWDRQQEMSTALHWLDEGKLGQQRDLRFPPTEDSEQPPPSLAMYEAALRFAGFEEVSTIWQHFDDRVLAAVKPS